jgi:hypothetical protein
MPKPLDRVVKRVFREKAVVRKVAQNVRQPTDIGPEQTVHSPTTEAGQPVEGQVRKEWNPREGGLPIFGRK